VIDSNSSERNAGGKAPCAFPHPALEPVDAARDRTALNLSILAALLFLPNGLHLPYFPVWLSARGLSDAEIAAALATPLVLRVVATPLIAAFADRRGIGITLSCV
jgi:PPP family 3-phenylpropionic acid transporter